MKKIRYWIEHLFLLALHGICKILPWTWASSIFGKIAEFLGTHMAMNRKAIRHIRAALQCDEDTAKDISKAHFNNLGRVMAEYPHLKKIATHYVRFQGLEHLERLRDDGQCGILFGAHLGNWEVLPHAILHHANLGVHSVYRPPNNPMVDKRLHAYRAPKNQLEPYSKSRKGMVGMVKALQKGNHIGLLIDQKYNEGVNAQFFGMNAKTGTAFIDMAKKYDCPLVPMRCIREKGGFLMDVRPPLATKDRETVDILNDAHALLEQWIKEYPSQWLWLHRRWKNEDLKDVT